jgi:hypothetical protein
VPLSATEVGSGTRFFRVWIQIHAQCYGSATLVGSINDTAHHWSTVSWILPTTAQRYRYHWDRWPQKIRFESWISWLIGYQSTYETILTRRYWAKIQLFDENKFSRGSIWHKKVFGGERLTSTWHIVHGKSQKIGKNVLGFMLLTLTIVLLLIKKILYLLIIYVHTRKTFHLLLGCLGLNCMVGVGTAVTSLNCSGDWATMTSKLQGQLGADWVRKRFYVLLHYILSLIFPCTFFQFPWFFLWAGYYFFKSP